MSYKALAKEASQAEQDKNWQKAHELWSQALEKVSPGNVNRGWAESRALFCQTRDNSFNIATTPKKPFGF